MNQGQALADIARPELKVAEVACGPHKATTTLRLLYKASFKFFESPFSTKQPEFEPKSRRFDRSASGGCSRRPGPVKAGPTSNLTWLSFPNIPRPRQPEKKSSRSRLLPGQVSYRHPALRAKVRSDDRTMRQPPRVSHICAPPRYGDDSGDSGAGAIFTSVETVSDVLAASVTRIPTSL